MALLAVGGLNVFLVSVVQIIAKKVVKSITVLHRILGVWPRTWRRLWGIKSGDSPPLTDSPFSKPVKSTGLNNFVWDTERSRQ